MDEIKRIKAVWESERVFIQNDRGASSDDRDSFFKAYQKMEEAARQAQAKINQIVNEFEQKWTL